MFVSSAIRFATSSPYIHVKSVCELDLVRTNFARTFYLSSFQPGIYEIDNKKENLEKPPPLDKEKAKALIMKLSENERNLISTALKEFEAQQKKEEYSGLFSTLYKFSMYC